MSALHFIAAAETESARDVTKRAAKQHWSIAQPWVSWGLTIGADFEPGPQRQSFGLQKMKEKFTAENRRYYSVRIKRPSEHIQLIAHNHVERIS